MRTFAMLLAASIALAQEPTELTPDQAESFAWFDSLGYPDVAGKPYVQAWTGRWHQSGDKPPRNTCVWGFLLSEEGDSFKVFTTGLDEMEFRRSQGEVKPHERVYYLAGDLEQTAREIVEQADAEPDRDEGLRIEMSFGPSVGDHVGLFFLARACAANGLVEAARDLYRVAEQAAEKARRREEPKGLRSAVAASIALNDTWGWTLAFGNPEIPRSRLLEAFTRIQDRFPDSEHHAFVKEIVEVLGPMVKEDEEHAKTARPLEELTGKERVAELVFQLRDQNGQQWSQPGECDVFLDPRRDASPAALLVKMGHEAVPQLLEVVEDARFTRSVGYWRNFSFDGHHVLRVGDCAKEVLERISGRSFYVRSSTSGYMSRDGAAGSVREQAEAWWKELQSKGETQVLVEAVEKGDRNSPEAAERLLKLAPDRALSPILTGLANAKESWPRAALVRVLGDIPGDEAAKALREEASRGPFLDARISAAWGLLPRSSEEAVGLMVKEWTSGPEPGPLDDWTHDALVDFLADCGRVEGVRALAEGLRKRSTGSRMDVVESVGDARRGRRAGVPEPGSPDARSALESAIEDLLAAELDDEEETRMSGSRDGQSFSHPRVCDLAAYHLAKRWEGKSDFRLDAAEERRNEAIFGLKNLWRDARGLEPLAEPKAVEIPPVSQEEIAPLLQRVLAGEDAEAEAAIEAMGLGALAATRKARATKAGESTGDRLDRLIARLASIVRLVEWNEEAGAFPQAVRASIQALEGAPLTLEGIRSALQASAREAETSKLGIRFSCRRRGDGTGVVVTATSLAVTDVPEKGSHSWTIHVRVKAGSERLEDCSHGKPWDSWRSEEGWDCMRDSILEALSAPADEPYSIQVDSPVQR
ncbi:MAG: hypothetical protein HY720_18445 [Planctomycetes bacterium]|nr:hypothetical protein [Planctomycetota bacterium]